MAKKKREREERKKAFIPLSLTPPIHQWTEQYGTVGLLIPVPFPYIGVERHPLAFP